jgi:hypothetical protein
MVPRKTGKVINIASIQGLTRKLPGKHADARLQREQGRVVNLTRTLANEWAPLGINVNAIAPGFFPTKMTAAISSKLGEGATAEMAPMRKTGGPEDLKGRRRAVRERRVRFITGQTLAVDGGLTAVLSEQTRRQGDRDDRHADGSSRIPRRALGHRDRSDRGAAGPRRQRRESGATARRSSSWASASRTPS